VLRSRRPTLHTDGSPSQSRCAGERLTAMSVDGPRCGSRLRDQAKAGPPITCRHATCARGHARGQRAVAAHSSSFRRAHSMPCRTGRI
jgi:hypothetical protein